MVDPLTIDFELGAAWAPAVQAYGGRVIVAPLDGSPVAFWAIDPATGDVVGGLPDGTGGAVTEDVERTLNYIDNILNVAERAGEMGEFNGITFWVELERTKAQIVGAVTILFGEGGEVPDLGAMVGDAVEGGIEYGIVGAIPGGDEATAPIGDLSDIYDAAEAATGHEMPEIDFP